MALASLKVAVALFSMETWMTWVVPGNALPVTRQCELTGVPGATYYARRSGQAGIFDVARHSDVWNFAI